MMQNEITTLLPDPDNYIIGFARMEDLLAPYYPYQYAVVIGTRLNDRIIDEIETTLTEEYHDLYLQKNNELNEIVSRISSFLNERNIDSQYIPASKEDLVPGVTLRNKYSHKMAATRAGMGWLRTGPGIANPFREQGASHFTLKFISQIISYSRYTYVQTH